MPKKTIPRFQEAFEYFRKGLPVEEIADRMSISISTVHSYISFAKKPQRYYKKVERRRERRKLNKLKRKGTVFVRDIEQNT